MEHIVIAVETAEYKDGVLARLADRYNVAQFVSLSPELTQRFARLAGLPSDATFATLEDACAALLARAESKAINIRSFRPGAEKGQKLIRDIASASDAAAAIRQRGREGFFTIANEVIPLEDGGVSGVIVGGVIEFAPFDTPKCVDEPGVASFPRDMGITFLRTIYGFAPEFQIGEDKRIEFSIHPLRRGIRHEHAIVWEIEAMPSTREGVIGRWPNRYSKFLGDKAYGLLVATLLGSRVPRTTVFPRNVAPFSFGESTGTREYWLRTCPKTPVAGKYLTTFGWTDPYHVLSAEDPTGDQIPSVLAQESVEPVFSGAAQTLVATPIIEGRPGRGDQFMVGTADRSPLPPEVIQRVTEEHLRLTASLESIKFEWVWSGRDVWVVQLHRRARG